MAKGTINVQAENIFPIIKKFLYSEHEIFLRELVSNAVDATSKLKALQKMGEYDGELGDIKIEVSIDKKAGTLTISDKGIGMNQEEVEKYLNQVAFSGASEFLQKYEGKADDAGIIGNFGLGFYSAFMVSTKVDVVTRSYKSTDEKEAVIWSCDGNPEYTIEKTTKKGRGSDIVLHITDEDKEFLEENRIQGILDKFCKFLPVEIKFGTKTELVDNAKGKKDKDGKIEKVEVTVDKIINNPNPAWKKSPTELKDEDYKSFYRELYPMTFEEPLFNIHLNVDYPFNLTGVLYFPRLKDKFEFQKNKIQLYSNQVFITDSVENIVPEFLTLLHGVIDSPDIPLNVSRSYLQTDSNVKKIASHISKKVADKLADMFKNDREDFQTKWDDIRIFIEYGMLTDEKFWDRIKDVYLFKNTKDEYYTIDEYRASIEENQKDKDGKIVHLYTSDKVAQHEYVAQAENRGYDVTIIDGALAAHMVQKFEQSLENVTFARVDADTIDKLIQKVDAPKSNLTEDQEKELKELIEGVVEKESYSVQFESLTEKDNPMVITQPEFMRRMKEQSMTGGGGMMGMANMPDMYNLVVNVNHPLVSKMLIETDADKKGQLAKQAADLAKLSQGLLKGEALSNFIKRSVELID
jgi:molecular chaperone HtpG